MRLPPELVMTLTAALDGGSFESAARALSITPSAVSQRIKLLEQLVGRVLLVRGRPITATDSGRVVMRFARQLELLERDVADELAPQEHATTVVSVVVNADSLATWFLPAVAALPGISLDLVREDQAHSTQLLRAGTVMAAVTSDPTPVQGCTVAALGGMTYRPTASRAFTQRWFATGATRDALTVAPVVVFDRKDDLQDVFLRRAGVEATAPPRHYVPGSTDFLTAVTLGMGWGMLPDEQAAGLVDNGELVTLDGEAERVPLYWQQWRSDSTALATVAAAVRQAAPRT